MAKADEALRQQQMKALKAAAGSWKDADHPELSEGAAAWVKRLRAEWEVRFQKIQKRRAD